MPPSGGYGFGYKPKVKGDFKPGDRVRVKYEFQGQTYAARAKRQGVWIVDVFKTANWELKRPDDAHVPYGYPKRLRAKPHQIEKVEDTPKPPATKHLLTAHEQSIAADDKLLAEPVMHGPHWTEEHNTAGDKITASNLDSMSMPADAATYKIVPQGAIVIANDPDPTGYIPKGKLLAVTGGNSAGQFAYVDLMELFTGQWYFKVKVDILTVIPQQDLTITYKPK